ncbi:MAG: 4-phosphopantetheinyl transferase family protein [Ktedonobacteraceae bacterium]|nr:4-phosphopantetheinyl transferase family protein [Ktedonobacteraceae bacterium]
MDAEYRRTGIEYYALAASHFSAHEYAALHELPADLQEEAFFLAWSRKEA